MICVPHYRVTRLRLAREMQLLPAVSVPVVVVVEEGAVLRGVAVHVHTSGEMAVGQILQL